MWVWQDVVGGGLRRGRDVELRGGREWGRSGEEQREQRRTIDGV